MGDDEQEEEHEEEGGEGGEEEDEEDEEEKEGEEQEQIEQDVSKDPAMTNVTYSRVRTMVAILLSQQFMIFSEEIGQTNCRGERCLAKSTGSISMLQRQVAGMERTEQEETEQDDDEQEEEHEEEGGV